MHGTTFVDLDIRYGMASLQKNYSMTLTYFLKAQKMNIESLLTNDTDTKVVPHDTELLFHGQKFEMSIFRKQN